MEENKNLKDQIKIKRGALENRMDKKDVDSFYDRAEFESKNELEFFGHSYSEHDLLEKILWRLDQKNNQLVELERKGNDQSSTQWANQSKSSTSEWKNEPKSPPSQVTNQSKSPISEWKNEGKS